MKQAEIPQSTDAALQEERRKMKRNNTINAFLIGIFIGIAVYSAANNGLGFATILPLLFIYFAFRNGKKTQALDSELKSRDLK